MSAPRVLPRALALLLPLGMAGALAAPLGDNTVKLAPSMFKLPQNIGPLRFSGDNRYSDRRMGRSFAYNASGISLNIFVYDYGERDLPDGPDSVVACEQYETAKREIERGGNYDNVVLRGEFTRRMSPPEPLPLTREAVYEFDRNGIHATSVLWLTAADGYFLKLRLSLRNEVSDELLEARTEILESLAAAIRARPAQPAIEAPPPREPSIEMHASSDADASLWLAYAVELNHFARENPQAGPPCGGVLEAPFDVEVRARQAALREYRARPANGRRSGYFEALGRVDSAGLMHEYVWNYLHRDAWGNSPPRELAMGRFEEFRARELATHEVQSGASVRIHAVRALPLAPDS